VLVFLALLGACVWVGGFIAIAVVAHAARRTLGKLDQIAFFRALGQSYGLVGGTALGVALVCGAVLLVERPWDGTATASVCLAALLTLVTAVAVAQARGMTRLRRRALSEDGDPFLAIQVRKGAARASALRAAIGVLSIGLLVLAVALS
jgi:hypothetical protein